MVHNRVWQGPQRFLTRHDNQLPSLSGVHGLKDFLCIDHLLESFYSGSYSLKHVYIPPSKDSRRWSLQRKSFKPWTPESEGSWLSCLVKNLWGSCHTLLRELHLKLAFRCHSHGTFASFLHIYLDRVCKLEDRYNFEYLSQMPNAIRKCIQYWALKRSLHRMLLCHERCYEDTRGDFWDTSSSQFEGRNIPSLDYFCADDAVRIEINNGHISCVTMKLLPDNSAELYSVKNPQKL